MHTASLSIRRHPTYIAFIGVFLLGTLFFSYPGHAAASREEHLSSLLSTTQLVLSTVSEKVGSDQALAAGTNSQDAEIERLTKLLNELIAMYQKLLAQQQTVRTTPIDNVHTEVTGTVTGAPVIRNFKPTTAIAEKSNTFVITGRNFDRRAVVYYTNSATGYSGTIYPAAAQNTEIIFALTPGRQGYVDFYVQNPDGSKSNTERVTIASQNGSFAAPTVTISAYPTQVDPGEKATITWSASQADSCSMNGKKVDAWGSVTETVRTSETFTVECIGIGGTTKKSVTVGVTQGAAPSISVTPSVDQYVSYGGTVTFEWKVTPTKGVTCEAAGNGINGKSSGEIALSGKWTTPKLYAHTTYGMKCTDTAGRSTYKYINLSVAKQDSTGTGDRPSISVSPRDATVAYGKTTTLEWSVTPTIGTTCEAAGTGVNGATGRGAVALSGKWTTPALYTSTTYGIRCTNTAGTEVKYVEVRVAEQKNEDTQPEITSVYPTIVSVGQAASFTIMGKNFASNATIGYTNSVTGYSGTLTPTRVNSNSIVLDITPSAKGEITFYVKHSDGKTSNTKSITVQ